MTENQEEIILNFTYTPPSAPEFRLYHDEDGKVICYTCENLEGKYIIVDTQTFAEARQDVRVVDGQIVSVIPNITVSKLKPSVTGTITLIEDISIIVTEETANTQKWKLDIYELK